MKTVKIKKVLIALDYDPTAQVVAEAGNSLAENMKATVTLLHVVADETYYSTLEYSPVMGFLGFSNGIPGFFPDKDGLKKATRLYLERVKSHLGNESIHILVKEGEFADTILQTADEIQADVIVMGSHSRKWLDEILMGSVTEKVMRHTKIPIYIVPTKRHS